jgi:ATP-binding protein involved in chromosome partitioning
MDHSFETRKLKMPEISEASIRSALASFQDPETGRSIVQLEQVHALRLEGDRLNVTLGLTTWAAPLWETTRTELAQHLAKQFPSLQITVDLAVHQRKAEKLGEIGLAVKSVIAVAAGKGGVGKSSIAAYLACGLRRAGCQVGLMDADVYGPSVPHLLGSTSAPQVIHDRIQPVMIDGMPVMSMGFLVPKSEAVIWRGPMLHTALTQFLRDTDWGELDYLIIDMPPGTGDVALSLTQLLPLTGAVIVCTPQEVALLDAVKAIGMFRKVNVDVLGMIENMSFFICPDCHSKHDIFGTGGAKRRADEMHVPFLGEIPLCTELRKLADEGKIASSFDFEAAKPYLESLGRNLVGQLAKKHRAKPAMPTLPILS